MTNIILPVDFGESTDFLLDETIKFAKKTNGKIFLIHVAPSDIGFAIGDMGFQYFPEIEKNEIQQEALQLNELQQRVIAQDVDCEHILKQGIAKEVILDYVQEKKADYIVMGSHGRSGIYDVFVGSLTKELTKSAPVPVLVIPCHQHKEA
ncbi:universal stress protein [Riemerella anatipestifer]|nr:universal stress protein [Riemerella anatipestifer]